MAALTTLLALLILGGCQPAPLISAKLYLQQNDNARAKEQLRRALTDAPDNAEAHYLWGRIAAMEERYAAMDSAFERSWQLSDSHHEAIRNTRRTHWSREFSTAVAHMTSAPPDYQASLDHFGRAIIIDPQPLSTWHNVAFAYSRMDSLGRAGEIFAHVLEAVPGDTTALAGLGAVYLEQERFRRAAQVLERLVAAAPDNLGARINLGMAYENLEMERRAEAVYREATELAPAAALAHYNLGNALWRRGEFRAAKAAYERALTLDPEDVSARYNLAVTCVNLEELDRAARLFEEIAVAAPDSGTVWRELGHVYRLQGRAAASRAALARADSLGAD